MSYLSLLTNNKDPEALLMKGIKNINLEQLDRMIQATSQSSPSGKTMTPVSGYPNFGTPSTNIYSTSGTPATSLHTKPISLTPDTGNSKFGGSLLPDSVEKCTQTIEQSSSLSIDLFQQKTDETKINDLEDALRARGEELERERARVATLQETIKEQHESMIALRDELAALKKEVPVKESTSSVPSFSCADGGDNCSTPTSELINTIQSQKRVCARHIS